MKTVQLLVVALLVAVAGAVLVHASDPTALYARIDKVVLEPGTGSPNAIQIWGVFSMAKPNDRNDYLPAERGYLYFNLADSGDVGRKEWADLKSVAGTGQVVSFGSRYKLTARLRKPDETPARPDPYVLEYGVIKSRNTDYAPIRALIDYKK